MKSRPSSTETPTFQNGSILFPGTKIPCLVLALELKFNSIWKILRLFRQTWKDDEVISVFHHPSINVFWAKEDILKFPLILNLRHASKSAYLVISNKWQALYQSSILNDSENIPFLVFDMKTDVSDHARRQVLY